jgi:hypothetical protein
LSRAFSGFCEHLRGFGGVWIVLFAVTILIENSIFSAVNSAIDSGPIGYKIDAIKDQLREISLQLDRLDRK